MYKIVVLLKQTFDTEEKIEIINGAVQEEGAKFVINPYDEYALEEALRIKEQHGAEVIVISVGPERSTHALRTALAVGADQAILIADENPSLQSSIVAQLLTSAITPMKPDLILAGLFSIDTGNGSVALQVAQLLGLPHAAAAVHIKLGHAAELQLEDIPWPSSTLAVIERDIEGDTETVIIPLPAVITAQQGLNEPRYPSLPGIMKAKKKPLTELFPSDLLTAAQLTAISTSNTQQTVIFPPAPRAAGKRLTGNAAEQTNQLLEQLLLHAIVTKEGK